LGLSRYILVNTTDVFPSTYFDKESNLLEMFVFLTCDGENFPRKEPLDPPTTAAAATEGQIGPNFFREVCFNKNKRIDGRDWFYVYTSLLPSLNRVRKL